MTRILCVFLLTVTATLCFAHDAQPVQEPKSLDGLLEVFNWDLKGAKITSQKITDNLYVLFGLGGNIAVSVGEDGVLIVDDQFPELIPDIKLAIQKLGGRGVDFAVNTHWHFDHAEGNLALGPEDTWLVSQANSRAMMLDDHVINLVVASYDQKAYPEDALPSMTFDETMQFHFNGEQIDLKHYGPAHTTGDTAVIFRGSNAVHLGDVYNNAGYPFIDAGNGGTLDGVIKFCSSTIAELNKDSIVIPGHGPVADYQALADYIDMLKTVRERMLKLIEGGASLDDVIAAKVTADWDEKNGDNTGFINRSYLSLTHKIVDR
jgi:cyclase